MKIKLVYRYRAGVGECVAHSVGVRRREFAGRAGRGLPPPSSVCSVSSWGEDVAAARLENRSRGNFEQWQCSESELWQGNVCRIAVRNNLDAVIGSQLFGLQCFYLDFDTPCRLPNWGCIRWSSATACTPLSASWRRELERWAYFFYESERNICRVAKQFVITYSHRPPNMFGAGLFANCWCRNKTTNNRFACIENKRLNNALSKYALLWAF